MVRAIRARCVVDTSGLAEVASVAKQRGMTLKAVKAGAKPIQAGAKARAPRRKKSGALKQSLGIKAAKGKRGKTLSYAVVGPRTKVVRQVPVGRGGRTVTARPAKYAHMVEKGTKPHPLGKGQVKAATRLGRLVNRLRNGGHPGAKAKPFLGPAFDSQKTKAAAIAEKVLGEEVNKAIAKAAARQRAKALKV